MGLEKLDPQQRTKRFSHIRGVVERFNSLASLSARGDSIDVTDEEARYLTQLRQDLVAAQQKSFPVLRQGYANVGETRSTLQDNYGGVGYAETEGPNHDTIVYVSARFDREPARQSAFIETYHNAEVEKLRRLRFKKAVYKTSPDGAAIKTFDIDSPSDDELVTWETNMVWLLG